MHMANAAADTHWTLTRRMAPAQDSTWRPVPQGQVPEPWVVDGVRGGSEVGTAAQTLL